MSDTKIAYSPRAAARIFEPALSERLIRRCVREGIFTTVEIGARGKRRGRIYLLRSQIEAALIELGVKQHDT
jgi:hypothetical protein